jgi:hypothetical protein
VRIGHVVALFAIAAVLAGCGGDPKPNYSSIPPTGTPSVPTSGSSAMPSVSRSTAPRTGGSRTGPLATGPAVRPGETPPTLGPTSRQHTRIGALDFAGYFIKALDWSVATNDPYLIQQISSPRCTACRRYVDAIRGTLSKRGYQTGGRIRILSIGFSNDTYTITADYAIRSQIDEEASVLYIPGKAPSTLSATPNLTSIVFVSWLDGHWQVVEQAGPES